MPSAATARNSTTLTWQPHGADEICGWPASSISHMATLSRAASPITNATSLPSSGSIAITSSMALARALYSAPLLPPSWMSAVASSSFKQTALGLLWVLQYTLESGPPSGSDSATFKTYKHHD